MTHALNATSAGPVTPKSDEAETTIAASLGPKDQNQETNSGTDASECKALAAFRSQLYERQYALIELSDASFLVSRWGYSTPLRDVHAVAQFARRVGGAL